jgi:murein DD-endopeptidase MepM/ murein hydrolase activator NlpD
LSYDSWYYCTGGFGTRYWKDGSRPPDFHKGVDYAAYYGTPIYAVNSGTVTISRLSPSFGNYVVIDHGEGVKTYYAHMSKVTVNVGDYVTQGTKIGEIGNTGYSFGAHLHFGLMINGTWKNPMNYLSKPSGHQIRG